MTTSGSPLPFLVNFYAPQNASADARGRKLNNILAWSDGRLEWSHDYIQILFPLPERSPINPSAPAINEQTFSAFRSRPEWQDRLRDSLVRMLNFYGFVLRQRQSPGQAENNGWEVRPGPNFSQASPNWLKRFDHNHLRITRIIRSCRVLGLEDEVKAFYVALIRVAEENQGVISQKSLMFWQRAAERPLYLAPEDEADEGQGKDFLYRFEEKRKSVAQDAINDTQV
ncbi:MAG: hypothetical protein LQ338_004031 [Usnochroma carphineum]|nr:MAG: hypothetical protein LQ338_004031 [Usnochroma carphineum]